MLPAFPINNTRGKKKSKTFLTCNQKFKYNEGNNQAFSLLFVLNNLLHSEIHVFIMWLFFLNCLGRSFNTSTFNNKGTLENFSLCVRWAKRFDTMTFNAAVIQEKWYTGYHNQPWPECWSPLRPLQECCPSTRLAFRPWRQKLSSMGLATVPPCLGHLFSQEKLSKSCRCSF